MLGWLHCCIPFTVAYRSHAVGHPQARPTTPAAAVLCALPPSPHSPTALVLALRASLQLCSALCSYPPLSSQPHRAAARAAFITATEFFAPPKCSPIMLLWFVANAAIGAWNISKHGASAFQALSPHYMYYYWAVSGRTCTSYQSVHGTGGEVAASTTSTGALMYISSAPHTCTPPSQPRPLHHAGPQPGGLEGAGQHPAVRDRRRSTVCRPGTLQRTLHPGELWLFNYLNRRAGCEIMRLHLQVETAARLARELSHVCSTVRCPSPCAGVNRSSPAIVPAHHRHRAHLLFVCTFRPPCAAVLCGGGLPLAAAHLPRPNLHDCQQVRAPGAGRCREAGVVEVQDGH